MADAAPPPDKADHYAYVPDVITAEIVAGCATHMVCRHCDGRCRIIDGTGRCPDCMAAHAARVEPWYGATGAFPPKARISPFQRVAALLGFLFGVVVPLAILAAAVIYLAGCAFAPTYDAQGNVTGGVMGFGIGGDEPGYDPNSPPYAGAAKTAGGLIGGIFGGPGGAAIGTGIGGLLASVFGAVALKQSKKRGQAEAAKARLEGREQGYVDYENDTTVRVVPPPAPVMVASAPAYAPGIASQIASPIASGVQPVSGTNAAGNSVPSVPVVEMAAKKPRRKA